MDILQRRVLMTLFKIHCMIKNKMERCLLYKTVNK